MTATLYHHPEYLALKEELTRYADLYRGKRERVTQSIYLWPHDLEMLPNDANSSRMWASRVQRTRYFNIPEVIISIWVSLFFSKPAQIDDKTIEVLGPRFDDADGTGTSFNALLKDQVLNNLLVYGRVWLAVDNYSDAPKNVAQQKAAGLFPFFSVLDPLSVVDWAIETRDPARVGKLNMLRQVYIEMLPRTEATQQPEYQVCSDVYLRRDGRYVLQKYAQPKHIATRGIPELQTLTTGDSGGWTLQWEAETQLEEIPIAYYFGTSWIKDVCEETLRFYNLRSNRDNILYYQGYQRLVIKGANLNDPEQRKAVSEYTMLSVPTDGDVFAIEPANTSSLDAAVVEAFDSAIKMGLNQLRMVAQDSKAAQSAEALDKEKENTKALISSTITELETLVEQALTFYSQFVGKTIKPEISILGSTEESQIESKLNLIVALKEDLKKLPTARKEVLKQMLQILIKDPEKFQDIEKEIEALQLETNTPRPSLRELFNGNTNGARSEAREETDPDTEQDAGQSLAESE